MSRIRPLINILFAFLFVMLSWYLTPLGNAAESFKPGYTVPTRTPTPAPTEPPPPTNTPLPPPPPTNTPVPLPTNTPIPNATFTPTATPLPSIPGDTTTPATACDLTPTYQTFSTVVFVYAGPGTNYRRLAQLPLNSIHWLTGRTTEAPWWQLELTPNRYGWVADANGLVNGQVDTLPFISPLPTINNVTPTPGPYWEPTPNPACPTNTPTPTSTATSTPTSTPTITPTTDPAASPTPTAATTNSNNTTNNNTATTTNPTIDPNQPTPTAPSANVIAPTPPPQPTPAPATNQPTTNGSSDWLLYFGLLLIGAGLIWTFTRRR
ncbi:MAG TPA: hypothetical protein VLL52_03490 [Anaerolineae bacterium]|nr:hypothetical protein [Anaerolineae bacterium]